MFGLLRGGCSLRKSDKKEWMGHICGVCLSLGSQFGQSARMATNYDAALISVLCAAQSAAPMAHVEHTCALRGMRRAEVVTTANIGTQYASSIALKSAATKLEDHVQDRDGWVKHFPWLSKRLFTKWHARSNDALGNLQLDHHQISNQLVRQSVVEAAERQPFTFYSAPTELAVAAAFGHTAVLTHAPTNQPYLFEMGRMYGRIMFLIDSYKDRAADTLAGKFNALTQACQPEQIHTFAQQQFQSAYNILTINFNKLTLHHPTLAKQLLIHQLAHIGSRTFSHTNPAPHCTTDHENKKRTRHCCDDYCFDYCCFDCTAEICCYGCCHCADPCCDCGCADCCCDCDCTDCCDCGCCID
ncbi:MAG: hypothetical protein GY943_17630 [Chloroflexi bacterium]|nr:hypothetical protein [Chloroflexota bacterium]